MVRRQRLALASVIMGRSSTVMVTGGLLLRSVPDRELPGTEIYLRQLCRKVSSRLLVRHPQLWMRLLGQAALERELERLVGTWGESGGKDKMSPLGHIIGMMILGAICCGHRRGDKGSQGARQQRQGEHMNEVCTQIGTMTFCQ
jgi:hypothetical protein